MPIFSQFGEIVWQRLFNKARILETTALKVYFWNFILYDCEYFVVCSHVLIIAVIGHNKINSSKFFCLQLVSLTVMTVIR